MSRKRRNASILSKRRKERHAGGFSRICTEGVQSVSDKERWQFLELWGPSAFRHEVPELKELPVGTRSPELKELPAFLV